MTSNFGRKKLFTGLYLEWKDAIPQYTNSYCEDCKKHSRTGQENNEVSGAVKMVER